MIRDGSQRIYMYEHIQYNLCKMATLKKPKFGFQDQLSLNEGQKYFAIPWSILQYFRPSVSYYLPLRSLFGLF